MQNTIKTILAAKRRAFLTAKPIFHYHAQATEMDLFMTARRLDCKLVVGLCQWLRAAGYGDINDMLIFRDEYFAAISQGALKGFITFARDEAGNAYAFKPEEGDIYFVSAQEHAYARMADDFHAFLEELIKRDYNLAQWRESLLMVKDDDSVSTP